MAVEQCCKRVYGHGRTFGSMCSKPGKVEIGGNWYCATHDPAAVQRRTEKWRKEYDAKRAIERKKWALESAAPALLESLEAVIAVYDASGGAPAPVTIERYRALVKKARGE